MLIPTAERRNIKQFIERYFVEDALSDAAVTNEQVRVLYYGTQGEKLGGSQVTRKRVEFDIYVRNDALYTADRDRLRHRGKLIGQRLRELLTGQQHVRNMRYTYEDDYALGAKTIGYRRWHVVFSYKVTG